MPRLARWVLRLAIVLLPLSWPQRAAAADDAIVLKVRGKSQLRLRDVSRRPDGKSTFRVTLQLQLSDGVATDAPGSDDRAFVDRLVTVQLRSSEGTLYQCTGASQTTSCADSRACCSAATSMSKSG